MQVYLWDARKGSLPRTQLEPGNCGSEVNSMQVSADGRTLLTANDHGDVSILLHGMLWAEPPNP